MNPGGLSELTSTINNGTDSRCRVLTSLAAAYDDAFFSLMLSFNKMAHKTTNPLYPQKQQQKSITKWLAPP